MKKVFIFLITITALSLIHYFQVNAQFRPQFPSQGGTGTTSTPLAGEILIGNSSSVYTVAPLTAGTNITITTSSGGITITGSAGGGGSGNVNVTAAGTLLNQVPYWLTTASGTLSSTSSITINLGTNLNSSGTITVSGVAVLTTSTGLTVQNFVSTGVSQWGNSPGYLANGSTTATSPITWSVGNVIACATCITTSSITIGTIQSSTFPLGFGLTISSTGTLQTSAFITTSSITIGTIASSTFNLGTNLVISATGTLGWVNNSLIFLTNASVTASAPVTWSAGNVIGWNNSTNYIAAGSSTIWTGLNTFNSLTQATGTSATSTIGMNTGNFSTINVTTCNGCGGGGSGNVNTTAANTLVGNFPWFTVSASSTLNATSTLFTEGVNLGIGTTKPSSTVHIIATNNPTSTLRVSSVTGLTVFDVNSTSTNTSFFEVQTSSSVLVFGVASTTTQFQNAILSTSSTVPVVSACGTTPSITGTNSNGFVTVGTGVISSCTITFSPVYKSKPSCVVSNESQNTISGTPTASTLVVAGTAIQSQIWHYICVGIREY